MDTITAQMKCISLPSADFGGITHALESLLALHRRLIPSDKPAVKLTAFVKGAIMSAPCDYSMQMQLYNLFTAQLTVSRATLERKSQGRSPTEIELLTATANKLGLDHMELMSVRKTHGAQSRKTATTVPPRIAQVSFKDLDDTNPNHAALLQAVDNMTLQDPASVAALQIALAQFGPSAPAPIAAPPSVPPSTGTPLCTESLMAAIAKFGQTNRTRDWSTDVRPGHCHSCGSLTCGATCIWLSTTVFTPGGGRPLLDAAKLRAYRLTNPTEHAALMTSICTESRLQFLEPARLKTIIKSFIEAPAPKPTPVVSV
jgi:hypothetical protein